MALIAKRGPDAFVTGERSQSGKTEKNPRIYVDGFFAQRDLNAFTCIAGHWIQSRKTEEHPRVYADSFVCFTRSRYIYHWRQ